MFDSVPDLTASMRASCPRGMGADCACAARLDNRLAAGESEDAILASYAPRITMLGDLDALMPHPGMLIAAVLHHLTRPRVSQLRPMSHSGPEGDMVMSDDGDAATESRFDIDAFLAQAAEGVHDPAGGNPDFAIDDEVAPTRGTMRRAAVEIDETVLV